VVPGNEESVHGNSKAKDRGAPKAGLASLPAGLGQRIVAGSQRAISGKNSKRTVVRTMAIINMLVPL
jgi:hypothetical protein